MTTRPDYDAPEYQAWLNDRAAEARKTYPVGTRVEGYSSGRSKTKVAGTIVGTRAWNGGCGNKTAMFPAWTIDGGKSVRLFC